MRRIFILIAEAWGCTHSTPGWDNITAVCFAWWLELNADFKLWWRPCSTQSLGFYFDSWKDLHWMWLDSFSSFGRQRPWWSPEQNCSCRHLSRTCTVFECELVGHFHFIAYVNSVLWIANDFAGCLSLFRLRFTIWVKLRSLSTS